MAELPRTGPHGLSLLGGPLHRLGHRLGLVRGHSNTVVLGLALGAVMWVVLLLLALIDGLGAKVFELSGVGAHVRLLVAVPLFFLCETLLDPRVNKFVEIMLDSGVVPAQSLPALRAEIARTVRWKDSWLPEAACLLAALVISISGSQMHLPWYGPSAEPGAGQAAVVATLTGQWYWIVCLTVVRFLLLRWLWRLGLWCHFLWRLSRLDLYLVPTHPDAQAGLGYLQSVHAQFTPLIAAISAIQASAFAQEIARGSMAFEALGPAILLVVGLLALLFLGPLLILAPRLWAARLAGLETYMVLGSRYVNAFDSKWRRKPESTDEPFLGTPDLQSLADLQNSLSTIDSMQWIPVGRRLLLESVAAALIPMLPLLLLKYPFADLIQSFVSRLVGT
jgi:hypothetical protein